MEGFEITKATLNPVKKSASLREYPLSEGSIQLGRCLEPPPLRFFAGGFFKGPVLPSGRSGLVPTRCFEEGPFL